MGAPGTARAARWQSKAAQTREAAETAADALRAWTQLDRAAQPRLTLDDRSIPETAAAANGHTPDDTPDATTEARRAGEGRVASAPASAGPSVRRSISAEPGLDGRTLEVLALPQPDWLAHELTVTGPADRLAAFRQAACGAGVVPWVFDYDRMEEDWFLLMMAPPAHRRGISAEGARILARQLRDLIWERHEWAVSQIGVSQACPFDLHALVPVPDGILRLGDDHPAALAWLWQHWGTTWMLRRVAELPIPATLQRRLADGQHATRVSFWAADWSPWPALRQISAQWPELGFDARAAY